MLPLKLNDTLTNIMGINRFNVLILQQEDFIDYQHDMGNPSMESLKFVGGNFRRLLKFYWFVGT